MANNQFFLGGVDLAGAALARVDEREAVATYTTLIEEIRARCGDDVASLFAEPVRGRSRGTDGESLSWYCSIEGTPFALRQLDAAGRQPVIELLKQRLRSFSSLLNDPRSGAVLGSWLYILSPDSLMAVAGQPVIKNWGMIPITVANSEEARDTHFRNTIGLYVPAVPTPPFTAIEVPSFPGRMAQLADREAARAAPPPPPPIVEQPAAQPVSPPPPPAAEPVAVPPRYRPWMAPAIASGLVAAVLVILLLSHLLRYPAPASDTTTDAAAIEAQRATNQALRDRLEQLKKGATNVCVAPTPAGGVPANPGGPSQPALLQPVPAQTPVTAPAAGPTPAGPSTLGELLDKSVVLILAGDSLGSGFFISDHTILTNHHVVADEREVRVGNKALGGLVPGRVVAVGAGAQRGTQDLAVIEIDPKPGTRALQLGIRPERLDPVTAAGYPGAVLETIKRAANSALPEANFTQGIATSHQNQEPAGIATIIHTAQIGHGNSGGPLVDAGGCVVGINSWLNFDAEDHTIFSTYFQALDASEVRKFLTEKQIAFTSTDARCLPAPPPVATVTPAIPVPPTSPPAPTGPAVTVPANPVMPRRS